MDTAIKRKKNTTATPSLFQFILIKSSCRVYLQAMKKLSVLKCSNLTPGETDTA